MATSTGKGTANDATVSTDARPDVLPANATEAEVLARLADEAEQALTAAETKRSRLTDHLHEADRAVVAAQKTAAAARRAAGKAK